MLHIYPLRSLLLLLLLLLHSRTVEPKLSIQSPAKLSAIFASKYGEDGIPYSIANYGSVPYGKSIAGSVGVPSVLEDCLYEEIPSLQDAQIIMAQRNDCTFTQKSLNIQKEGGKLAIIMDNVVQQPKQLVMVDDGQGFQVKIPTILISREDGEIIIEYIKQKVVLSVKFQTVQREKTHLQLWVDFTDHKNIVFLRNFQPYFNRIASHLKTKVGYPVSSCSYDCSLDHCLSFKGKDGQSNQTYCRFPRPQDWLVQDGGKLIMEEQFYQSTLFNDDNEGWWKYVLKFDETCSVLVEYQSCRQQISKALKINYEHINGHLQDILSNKNGSEQNLLNWWQQQRSKHGIIYYPSVVVNQLVYRGNLEPVDVFDLICESLTPIPAGCKGSQDQQQLNLGVVIGLTVIVGLSFVVYLVFCWRKMARRQVTTKMHGQINSLVQEYITMFQERKFQGEQGETQLKEKAGDM